MAARKLKRTCCQNF